jgi:tight adherence protein C
MEITPQIVIALTALLSLALLAGAGGSWLAERRARMHRVQLAMGTRSRTVGKAGAKQGSMMQDSIVKLLRRASEKFSPLKGSQTRDKKVLLISAGFRSRDAIIIYTFFKLVSPLVFLMGGALYIYGLDPIGRGPGADAFALLVVGLFGSKLPDIILKNMQQKRMESIRKSLPDALDMLVICAEAGLASDASLKRVVAETNRKSSVLGEELNLTAMELSFMPERRQALENLAERAPMPAINAFVNSMIQAEKYGTPLARAYKVLSQEQRAERMMRAEEKAGRLPATMTVPMMLFILPALFVVLIGPAILDVMDNFIGMN